MLRDGITFRVRDAAVDWCVVWPPDRLSLHQGGGELQSAGHARYTVPQGKSVRGEYTAQYTLPQLKSVRGEYTARYTVPQGKYVRGEYTAMILETR